MESLHISCMSTISESMRAELTHHNLCLYQDIEDCTIKGLTP